jgi:hypothetical protein
MCINRSTSPQQNKNISTQSTKHMNAKLTIGIIGCTLLTVLNPSILAAQTGTDFGTNRQPRTCSSRSAPSSGAISAAQAAKYAACEDEGDNQSKLPGSVNFVDILSLQVAKPRRVNSVDISSYGPTIDENRPIYPITGKANWYTCFNLLGGIYQRGQNCIVVRSTDSRGNCYKTTSNKWACKLSHSGQQETKVAPPASR